MDNKEFKATHKVVKLEPGSFVFAVGTLLHLIDEATPNYFVDDQGNRKYVEPVYVKSLDAITIEEQEKRIQSLEQHLETMTLMEKVAVAKYQPIANENEQLKRENYELKMRANEVDELIDEMRDIAEKINNMGNK